MIRMRLRGTARLNFLAEVHDNLDAVANADDDALMVALWLSASFRQVGSGAR